MDQFLTILGAAILVYWLWAVSKGRARPFIVEGTSGVIVLLVGAGLLILGLVL